MANNRAPKQWQLTKHETVVSFESWKQNLIYILSLDEKFSPFLQEDMSWMKRTTLTPLRGFTNDGDDIRPAHRLTAGKKVQRLEFTLGQIANFCTIISKKNSEKFDVLKNIWQLIRLHNGFKSTGGHFLNLAEINIQRPGDLFQPITNFLG